MDVSSEKEQINTDDKNKQTEIGWSIYFSKSNRWYLIKTLVLVFTWISLGSHLEMIGTTMNILSEQNQVNSSGISYTLVFRSCGYMLPNIIGSLIASVVKNHPELFLSISYFIAFTVMLVTPLIKNIALLCSVFLFQGISQGVTDLAGTSLILSMWPGVAGAPMNIVHLGYGFGAVFSNILVLFFVDEINKAQSFRIPYWISSFICLVISLSHLLIWIRQKKINRQSKPAESDEAGPSKQKKSQKPSQYVVLMSIIWTVYLFFLSGNDQTFGKFFFVYLRETLHVDQSMGTVGLIIFWLSYSFGRFIFALLAVYMTVTKCLNLVWILGVVIISVWLISLQFLAPGVVHLFVLGSFTALTFSPTFPLSFTFINQQIKTNPFVLGLFLCGGSIGGLVFQRTSGSVLDNNPTYFPYLMIICVSGSIVFYILALITVSFHRRTIKAKEEKAKKSLPKEEIRQIESELVTRNENS